MEELKEIQTLYNIFRIAVYVSVVIEFIEIALKTKKFSAEYKIKKRHPASIYAGIKKQMI